MSDANENIDLAKRMSEAVDAAGDAKGLREAWEAYGMRVGEIVNALASAAATVAECEAYEARRLIRAKANLQRVAIIEDGMIVIRVSVDVLPDCLAFNSWMPTGDNGRDLFRVVDADELAKDIVNALADNRGTGNMVSRMFDEAMYRAFENGSEGIASIESIEEIERNRALDDHADIIEMKHRLAIVEGDKA